MQKGGKEVGDRQTVSLIQSLGDVLIQLTPCYPMSTNTTAYSWRRTMAFVPVQCPECHSTDVVQYGKQANGIQRYRCGNRDCPRTIFLLQDHDKGRFPAVKQQSVAMTLNGSGGRDIVRVFGVSSAIVIEVLKKKSASRQASERKAASAL
jgi:transposase-like protein